jgi:hypothetical protein
MSNGLDYLEILQLLSDEELEDEYGWHRTRGKDHRRRGRYGLYWWHQKHAGLICDEIGRRSAPYTQVIEQLSLDVPGRIEPDLR